MANTIKTFRWQFVPKVIKQEWLALKWVTLEMCQRAKWERITDRHGHVTWRMNEGQYIPAFSLPKKRVQADAAPQGA